MLKTPLGRLRLAGLFEGTSFLLLLGVAMPLKYLAGQPMAVSIVGAAHGFLFVLYAFLVLQVGVGRDWPVTRMLLAWVAAVLPFGPFIFDRSLKEEEAREQQKGDEVPA